jgi:hypothetical protein
MKAVFIAPIPWFALTTALDDGPYFPIKTMAEEEGVLPRAAEWYGKSLERMKEPNLPSLAKDVNTVVYRLLILPNNDNPMAVRVNRHGTIYRVSARRLDGRGGYDLGKLVESKEVELSTEDSTMLELLIHNVDFFRLLTDDDVLGQDADEWILEGVSNGRYHVVQRCCVTDEPKTRKLTAFLSLCRFLLDKSMLSERPTVMDQKLRPTHIANGH